MCSFIPFSIPYLGHCGSNSSREFQSLSFLLQLLQENIEATSQLLLCLHQKMSARGPIKIFVLLQFPFCSLKPLVWNFCFPALPTCSLIFKEHPAMQLHCSTASGHMVSSVWKHPVMLVLMGLPRGCGPESSRLFFHNAFFFFFPSKLKCRSFHKLFTRIPHGPMIKDGTSRLLGVGGTQTLFVSQNSSQQRFDSGC